MEITIRKALSMAAAAVAATVMLASCQKDDPQGDGEGSSTTKLATPALSVSYPEDGTFTVSWTAVEHADSYSYTVNGGTETSTQNTSFTMTGQASGTYSIRVKAVSADEAYEDSNWAGVEATVENGAVIAGGREAWVGTWTISSDKTFTWLTEGQSITGNQLTNTAKSGTVIIELDPEYETDVVIYGLSPDMDAMLGQSFPAYGTVENGKLVLYDGVRVMGPIDEASQDGWIDWSGIGEMGGQYGLVTGGYPAFTFTLSGNTATSEPYVGQLSNGGTFTVVTYDAYLIYDNSNEYGIYTTNSYAGTLTLTKKSSSTSGSSFSASSMPAFTSLKAKYPGVQAKAMMVK